MYNGARTEKQRIRQEIRMISKGLSPEYRQEASREITLKVLNLPSWKKAKTVMAFRSMPEEPDTQALLETALREGKTLLLPRCLDGQRMAALPVKDLAELRPGRMGIQEPPVPEEGTELPEPDLVLVPCMAAAPNGIRLGHGAGYYDRFLEKHPVQTVCLCFRALLRSDLPAEETDIPVDFVISD
ncbi:5-formyltetrahydrofolate cyclo-ligase [Aristaeella lactis]|uniref:5-formyltetrahydrofolate cyclo-ligase n=1 Tax=Aristaeella lactis TaxID=3046383 RepID=A0AC61PMT5_9FIRM|nr:5-formyltetrahydrofolate cyclo-ligase [Aristaeella lactis]QUA52671.1 5-formyltetrahydrofolate cyclo-ligase [Aristaeella lactis]SMC71509.1 5-formyltetrahydrofolate cyclo-ligase [Aristaeella lactis]